MDFLNPYLKTPIFVGKKINTLVISSKKKIKKTNEEKIFIDVEIIFKTYLFKI
tara:strand:- start:173 stop:331 length:159 start_codon:yes stop_codon:yes gene_type:complete